MGKVFTFIGVTHSHSFVMFREWNKNKSNSKTITLFNMKVSFSWSACLNSNCLISGHFILNQKLQGKIRLAVVFDSDIVQKHNNMCGGLSERGDCLGSRGEGSNFTTINCLISVCEQ